VSAIPQATVRARVHPIGPLSFAAAGAILASAIVVAEPARGWAGVLIGAVFGLTIALGGALFAAIFAATGATFWLPIRRAPLAIAGTMPVPAAVMLLVVGLGVGALYPWADPSVVARSHVLPDKAVWLGRAFFSARAVAILVVWLAFVTILRRKVVAGLPLARTAIGFLVVFALTISLACWDWLLSLEPEWYSTMHGVYLFAGTLQAGIAATALLALGRMRDRAGPNQVRSLGALLFAFSAFWGYIWFCQGMLIWYANIPEETIHYSARLSGGHTMLFWLDPILNLAVPFVALLSIHARRSPAVVAQVAFVVLVGHALDLYLLVGPAIAPAASLLPYAAAGATVAVLAGMAWRLAKDPFCDHA
jgi:hypothetical protein